MNSLYIISFTKYLHSITSCFTIINMCWTWMVDQIVYIVNICLWQVYEFCTRLKKKWFCSVLFINWKILWNNKSLYCLTLIIGCPAKQIGKYITITKDATECVLPRDSYLINKNHWIFILWMMYFVF